MKPTDGTDIDETVIDETAVNVTERMRQIVETDVGETYIDETDRWDRSMRPINETD